MQVYKAFDKINKCEISFSHESDAIRHKAEGLIDAYEAYDYAEPAKTLEQVKTEKLAEISAARWNAIEQGTVEYAGLKFHTDSASQGLLGNNIQLYQVLQTLPQAWKAKDGYLPITSVDQLVAIGGLVAQFVETQFGREFTLAAQVNAATTVEEVGAIAWADS